MKRVVLVVLSVLALGSAAPAHAQDAALDVSLAHRAEVLEARLVHRPTPHDRCELGLVYQRQGRTADAIHVLDQAIAELGVAAGLADRRSLATCLFSRGRAAEDANDIEHARAFYVHSLELREARETRARVEALDVAAVPTEFPAAGPPAARSPEEQAAAALAPRFDGLAETAVVARPTSEGASRWCLVASVGRDDEHVALDVVVCDASGCHAAVLNGDATYQSHGTVMLRSFVVHDGPMPVLEVRTYESAVGHDGRQGAFDVVQATFVYFCSFTQGAVSCAGTPLEDLLGHFTREATYADGHVTFHRVSGLVPAEAAVPLDRPLTIAELTGAVTR